MLRKLIIVLSLGAAINTVSAIEIDELKRMGRYFSAHYYELIEDLREGRRVKRTELINAYEGDPFLRRMPGAGHGKFEHTYDLPIVLGVIEHDSKDIESHEERKSLHDDLQVYVNIFNNNFDLVNPTAKDKARFEKFTAKKEWQARTEIEKKALAVSK